MLAEMTLRARQDAAARDQMNGEGGGGNDMALADKWQFLRALTEARARFGLSDRTIGVLEALLSFHPGKSVDGARAVVVFPSNRELSLRSRGMAAATLRRHLAALVDAGLVLRRDSPNGKRFRRPGMDGEAEEVFGFDLSPVAVKAGEVFEAAEEERRRFRAAARLRSAISLLRRDIAKVIEAALTESRAGPFENFAARLATMVPSRRAELADLTAIEADLTRLCAEVENAYLSALSEQEMSANERETERHHENSNEEPNLESIGHRLGKKAEPAEPDIEGQGRRQPGADLGTVLRLCPDIADYAKDGIHDWGALQRVAQLVRGFLGISQPAWKAAEDAMGGVQASIVVACILQRASRIRSPGGYLRDLTERAKAGRFTVEPMLRALDGG